MHSVRDLLRIAEANGWQVTAQHRRSVSMPREKRLRSQPRHFWVPQETEGHAPEESVEGADQ